MALILPGKTLCPICGKPIEADDRAVAFSAFVPNEVDPLYYFHDAAFHEHCFNSHPLAAKALARQAEIREHTQIEKRICNVCDIRLTWQDEFIFLGFITDDIQNPLFRFNYIHLHQSCLPNWTERNFVMSQLKQLREAGIFNGRWVELFLNALK